MPPTGPDDRKERARQGQQPDEAQSAAEQKAADVLVPGDAPPRRERSSLPPGMREEEASDLPRRSDEEPALTPTPIPTIADQVGQDADLDAEPSVHRDRPSPDAPRPTGNMPPQPWDRDAYPPSYARPVQPESTPSPSQAAQRYDRFGWPIPEGGEARSDEGRPAPPDQPPQSSPRDNPPSDAQPLGQGSNRPDTSSWRIPPAPESPPRGPYSGQFPAQSPNLPPRGPYSGQFPVQPPRQSGAFPISLPPDATRSGQFDAPPAPSSPDDRRSGQFPVAPRNSATQSGAYALPPDGGTSEYAVTASGPIPQSPYISGPIPRVDPQADAEPRSGQFAYPSEVTSTGSRRVIVAPDAGVGSLLADRPALAFLLAAVALVGAMIAYIALRYSHFPNQIALHFGPAGPGEPNRIGEKRELWTIPFIVGIVLAANTALSWAVYRYDRFAARLLTLGCALVGAIAWVVLLTLLHR